MGRIIINTDEVINRSKTIKNIAQTERQTLSSLNTLIMNLTQVWRGDAQDTLVMRYYETKQMAEHFIGALEDYAKLMDQKAREFSETESDTCIRLSMVDCSVPGING